MSVLEIIFGVIIPTIMGLIAAGLGVYVVIEYIRCGKPGWLKPKKKPKSLINYEDWVRRQAAKIKPERYLVVCHNKKWAKCLWRDLCEYLSKEDIKFRYFEKGQTYNIDIIEQDVRVRFVSEYSFYEVSRGFHGWVVDDSFVDKYLTTAKEIERLKKEYGDKPDSVDDAIQ